TDRIDARVIAHFAEAVKPAPRPLPDAETQELRALLVRRRQLVEMVSAERARLDTVPPSIQDAIQAHIAWLTTQIAGLDDALTRASQTHPVWQAKDDVLQSIPGVGPVLAPTMLGQVPELGRLGAERIKTSKGPLTIKTVAHPPLQPLLGGGGVQREHTMQTTVGIVGLGNAGSAMATALSGKMGLVGFDANPERRHAVAHLALEWVPSLSELANRAGTVVLSLPKPEISKAVVTELVHAAKAPELIIETSTITPQVAQELGAICQP